MGLLSNATRDVGEYTDGRLDAIKEVQGTHRLKIVRTIARQNRKGGTQLDVDFDVVASTASVFTPGLRVRHIEFLSTADGGAEWFFRALARLIAAATKAEPQSVTQDDLDAIENDAELLAGCEVTADVTPDSKNPEYNRVRFSPAADEPVTAAAPVLKVPPVKDGRAAEKAAAPAAQPAKRGVLARRDSIPF
jgi:hypothetical protein